MSLPAYEKMGAFYLGKVFDPDASEIRDDLLLYDAKDLTTHAVCVGMTGSGKTGLCLSLLEEALIDGVPAIAIDPKGDLGNLMLTFPNLEPSDFEPWVDPGEATRKGLSVPAYAKKTAELWKTGLASWDQDGERIQRLKDAGEVAIYTPGSSAGLPLCVLRSFSAPPVQIRDNADAMRERVMSSVSSLLALLGIDADPIRSREHILLSNVLHRAWSEGRDLDLGRLIQEIQQPPFERIGVMDLESFFPSKDRFALAMTLNNLLASPGFQAWLEGEALDIQRLLWTPEGKPRLAILSIAHLSDEERMFFVTLLLGEVLTWMRAQPGTSSLRALLYMDEVFGFLPPTANPPSKTPLLTLLKQARAFGLGTMLATQNPVDLDYKALSNAGTWFLGRLQTERDKARVLDGLEGASASAGVTFDRKRIESFLSGVKSRVFLMNNVHEDAPVAFHTRWAMSYLRGPLTRSQITTLMAEKKGAPVAPRPTPTGQPATAPPPTPETPKGAQDDARPILPPEVVQTFIEATEPASSASHILYRPALVSRAQLHFVKTTREIDEWRTVTALAPIPDRVPPSVWSKATIYGEDAPERLPQPEEGARFGRVPKAASDPKAYRSFGTRLKAALYRDQALTLWRCPKLRLWSEAGETQGDFQARVSQLVREKRDEAVGQLEARYAKKVQRLQERVRKAEQRIEKEEQDVSTSKQSTLISIGQTILGALFGRKKLSTGTVGRAGTTLGKASRMQKEKEDVERAKADAEAAAEELRAMEAEAQTEIEKLQDEHDPAQYEVTDASLKPRKSDIQVEDVVLAWTPWAVSPDGVATPIFPTRRA